MAEDTEYRAQLAKTAARYGIPESKLPAWAAAIAKLHAASKWEDSGKSLDEWLADTLKAQNELLALLTPPTLPGSEKKPGLGNLDGKSYKEVMQLAEYDPAAFKKWYMEHRQEFEGMKAKALGE